MIYYKLQGIINYINSKLVEEKIYNKLSKWTKNIWLKKAEEIKIIKNV